MEKLAIRMKLLVILVLTSVGAVWSQTPPAAPQRPVWPDIPGDKVIARFDDGTQFTMDQLRQLYPVLPPALQNAVTNDPVEFFHEYALMRSYTKMAEKDKLDEQEPYKDALAFNRLLILYQAVLDRVYRDATVQPQEVVNYYDSHKEMYKQVRVKAIYLPFSETPSITEMTEEAAKATAAKLVAESRRGADFVKLVKENSQDATSRDKDGEFATLHPTDNIPDAIKAAVFALKQGDTSDPVRQSRGYYIFKAEEVAYLPSSRVRDQIYTDLKTNRAKAWVGQTDRDTKVEFPNPDWPPKKQQAGR
jgi:peptidyl-prolyl cis-trans isomerase C